MLLHRIFNPLKNQTWVAGAFFLIFLCATADADAGKNESNRKISVGAVTILTDDFAELVLFYKNVFGFDVVTNNGSYANFHGVPLAIASRQTMVEASGDPIFAQQATGQSFEIAFAVQSPEMVDTLFRKAIAHGGEPIREPMDTSWGQRVAFFKDPDGNIHDIYATIPSD
ncbi:MAG: VOC family protein [Marinicaulis sp.]|nr:VOC family protein [Marinicaulis sp.]